LDRPSSLDPAARPEADLDLDGPPPQPAAKGVVDAHPRNGWGQGRDFEHRGAGPILEASEDVENAPLPKHPWQADSPRSAQICLELARDFVDKGGFVEVVRQVERKQVPAPPD